MTRLEEVISKLERVRDHLGHRALRLRGSDWFAWATAGGSNVVLLTAETGIAEVLISADQAWILTDEIEAARLIDEELPAGYEVHACAWAEPAERDKKVAAVMGAGPVLSDRPLAGELPLPQEIVGLKRVLSGAEIERYREVGRLAAEAMLVTLNQAEPDWTEQTLAGVGAQALWARGLHPALTLAAGSRRVQIYRHPTAQQAPLGDFAMLVFCARGYGLYANLTRFITFKPLGEALLQRHRDVAAIEGSALDACKDGVPLKEVYKTLDRAYREHGYGDEIRRHHQGGSTGYLAREIIATPRTPDRLVAGNAVAFNPSLVGAKIEDTFVLSANGLENMTMGEWPAVEYGSRLRPAILQRT